LATPTTSPNSSFDRLIERLLLNRNFALLWIGDVISALGDYSFSITLTIWVGLILGKGQPWAPLAVIGLVLTSAFPAMIVGPAAGVYVDRWDKRTTMMWVDAIQAALVGVLLLMTFAHLSLGWEIAIILTVNFLLVAVDQFYNQAGFPLIIDLVGVPQIGKAISRVLVFVSIGTLIGPAVGAPLIVFWGPRWALFINMLSFIVSLVLIFAINAPKIEREAQPQEHKAFWPEFFAGVRFLAQSPFLRVTVIALAIETLGSSATNGLNLFFIAGTLHAPIALFGLLATAIGLGTLIGSTVANRLIERFGDTRVFWVSLLLGGLLLMVYSRLGAYIPALILVFIMGIPAGTINVVLGPMIARSTPREMMGRTNAARVSLITVAGFAGSLIAGTTDTTLLRNFHVSVLGMTFGTIDTIFLVGGAIASLGGIYAMRYLAESKIQEAAKEAALAESVATASAVPSQE